MGRTDLCLALLLAAGCGSGGDGSAAAEGGRPTVDLCGPREDTGAYFAMRAQDGGDEGLANHLAVRVTLPADLVVCGDAETGRETVEDVRWLELRRFGGDPGPPVVTLGPTPTHVPGRGQRVAFALSAGDDRWMLTLYRVFADDEAR